VIYDTRHDESDFEQPCFKIPQLDYVRSCSAFPRLDSIKQISLNARNEGENKSVRGKIV